MKRWIKLTIILSWMALIYLSLYTPNLQLLIDKSKTLTIFTWGDMLAPELINAFEKETGSKVRINYYASNEELIVKMKATNGKGYDIIFPSDYAIPTLQKENLLRKLDHSKLKFWGALNRNLMDRYYDPGNQYAIPFEWELYGIGIDRDFFKDKPFEASWNLLFNGEQIDYKVAMLNDPIMSFLIARFYLYGTSDNVISPIEAKEIEKLLKEQKKWVEAYVDFRPDYFLATKNTPVAMASSAYIWRARSKYPFIDFVVPKEGTYLSIEHIAVSNATKKEELVYAFLNFMHRPDYIKYIKSDSSFFPAIPSAVDSIELEPEAREFIEYWQSTGFKETRILELPIPKREIQQIWIDVKTP